MTKNNLKEKTSSSSKCSSCGSIMVFEPKTGNLECKHCGNIIELDNHEKVIKKPFDNIEKEFASWDKESVVVQCENCGSKEVVDKVNISHVCSFCGSSKMISINDLPGLKPNGVLPFVVTEKEATQNFHKWLKKKWFTPKDLKTSAKINTFGGVYTPTWSYDTITKTKYAGVLYKTERRRDRNGNYHTYTKNFPVGGSREDTFTDVLIPVGQKIDRISFKGLEPFEFKNLTVYNPNYLAGFSANHYSIPANEAWKSAIQSMKSDITRRIVRRHGADGVNYLNMDTSYEKTQYSYILLPIWVCSYYYKQKLYNFFINGSTGKVTGKVPRSPIKIILFILLLMLLFFALPYWISTLPY